MKIKGDFSKIKATLEKAKKNCCFRSGIFFSYDPCYKSTLFIFMKKFICQQAPRQQRHRCSIPHLGIYFPRETLGIFSHSTSQPLGHHNPSHFQLVNFQLNLSPWHGTCTTHLLFKHIHMVLHAPQATGPGGALYLLWPGQRKNICHAPFCRAHRGLRRKGKCACLPEHI